MNKSYSTLTIIVLLVLALSSFVPTLNTNENSLYAKPTNVPMNIDMMDAKEKSIERDSMHFSPSVSNENGIHFVCRRGLDAIAYFGESEVYYGVNGASVKLDFPGSRQVLPVGEKPTGSVTNYLLGNNPSLWQTGLQDFAVLRYIDIYPGIDLLYRLSDNDLKYEFVISPGANPDLIQMRYPNSDSIRTQKTEVTISTDSFSFSDTGLIAFQENDERADVNCQFQSLDETTIIFEVEVYDESEILVIDPVLVYSTFLGSSGFERGTGIAVDTDYVYVTGSTESVDFPMMNANDSSHNGNADCYVTKFAQDGQTLLYSTFIGGDTNDYGHELEVSSGYAYIVGETNSDNFPAYYGNDSTHNGNYDCFIVKLSTDGQSIVYSSYLGGSNADRGYDVAVEADRAYVIGATDSSDFPDVSAYDSTHNGGTDCFVTKFSIDGQTLEYCTFLGGPLADAGNGIAVEGGHAYVTGSTASPGYPTVAAYDGTHNGGNDCFLTKLGTSGNTLDYSTFLGGASLDEGWGIAVDDNYVYLAGNTWSSAFPTLNAFDSTYDALSDCFVTRFTSDTCILSYSTFLGGESNDKAYAIDVLYECAYITGETSSVDFPTVNAYDSSYNEGGDCFMSKLSHSGYDLMSSTFLGGSASDTGNDIVADTYYTYIVGTTYSSNFPTTDAYNSTFGGIQDCFVSAFADDSDNDGLLDFEEEQIGTDAHSIDTDTDNFLDGYEVEYGSDPLDPLSYPAMPEDWYDGIYEDLDGNTTLIQQIISWLDGNHSAIDSLFTFVEGNATLLLDTVSEVDGNSTQLNLIAALATQNADMLSILNASHVGNVTEIREILDMLGATVGD
ncbi:MAG: DUF7948 domain-containing protein, partial [Candidatus Thorarchaeota archaeon]